MNPLKNKKLITRSSMLALFLITLLGVKTTVFGDDESGGIKGKEPASMPLSPNDNWDLVKILSLNREQVMELWSQAPAAPMSELNGHYMGLVPNDGDAEKQLSIADFMYNEASPRGYWLGKAYKATSATEGIGYNRWRLPGGKIVRNGRFSTRMGTSLIDGKPALLMFYGTYNPDSTLIDEIRKLNDYVYLGLGSSAAADGTRSDPGHFMLIGPTDEWVGVSDF